MRVEFDPAFRKPFQIDLENNIEFFDFRFVRIWVYGKSAKEPTIA